MNNEEDEDQEILNDEQEFDDDEVAYLQTKKALNEALAEQKILKEKLTTLESRNKPAKWGNPVIVQKIDTTGGNYDPDSEMSPEQLLQELKTVQHMLENAKRASETARAEKKELENELAQLIITSQEETEAILKSNAAHHKSDLQAEQLQFRKKQIDWGQEKSDLLNEAEELSMVSHDAVHKASEAREFVDQQRKKIHNLAAELRNDLTVSKDLRDKLDDAKTKVSLIPNLLTEIDINKNSVDNLNKGIGEQRQILKAARVSKQAQTVLDDIAKQTEELIFAKKDSERTFDNVTKELKQLEEKEAGLNQKLNKAREDFKNEQMLVFVLEAELRELKSEHSRVKAMVIEEGRKNVALQKTIREEKMDATMRYIKNHSNEIHRVERVQSSLMNVSQQYKLRSGSALPPLKPNTRRSSLR